MAFSKKTWKDRSVQHPNRRTLTNTTSGTVQTVDVARAEGEISEAGDAFSASNMNDLESRVADALDAGLFVGKMTSVTSTSSEGVIDTNIDLRRESKVGDRILVYFNQKVTNPSGMKIYNNGTAVTTGFGMVLPTFYLKDLCIFEYKSYIESQYQWNLVQRIEFAAYSQGDGISIINGIISNSKPQDGDNIKGYNITSSIGDGNLGNFDRKANYILLNFKADAVPNNDGYYTAITSQTSPVAIINYYVLKNMNGSNYEKEIYSGMSLLCKMKNEGGSGTQQNPYYMTVVAESNWYVQIGAATGTTPGHCSTIEGQGNEVTGERSYGGGYLNTVSGDTSHAGGFGNTVSGNSSFAEGSGNNVAGDNAFALGQSLQVGNDNQTAFGLFNNNKSGDLLEVGNGEFGNRSNALEVKSNGNVVAGNDIVDGNGYTLSTIVDVISTEKTVSGNPITVTDALPYNAVSLSAEIEAVQDLHGYDHPWTGGAGKNKLPATVANYKANNTSGTWSGNNYTLNGITYAIQTDNDGNVTGINATTGTASADAYLYLDTFTAGGTSYILNGCPATGSWGTYAQGIVDNGTDYGSGLTFSGNGKPYIKIANGYTIPSGGLLFKPMIRLASESDATFAPYSNICPISGRTVVVVNDHGKNVFDKDHANIVNLWMDTNYSIFSEGANYRTIYIRCKANTTYTISKVAGKTFRVATSAVIPANQKHYLSSQANHTGTAITITTESNASYLAVLFWSSNNGDTLTPEQIMATLQIEEGSQATAYVPFVANVDVTIQLGQTVYDGNVDITEGSGDSLTALAVYDGSNDESWAFESIDANKNRVIIALSGAKASTTNVKLNYGIQSYTNDVWTCYVNAVGNFILYLPKNINDLTAWRAFLSTTNLQIKYELATADSLSFTPTQLTILKGYNRLSSDGGGDMSITYKADRLAAIEAALAEIGA